MVRLLKDNSGFALILTILIISLIVALTLEFNSSMRTDLHSAANLRDGIRLNCIARSGVNCAIAILREDISKTDFDCLHEVWAHSKVISEATTSMFDHGRFAVDIKDLSGTIQINQLVDENGSYDTNQKGLLTAFLNSEQFGLNNEDVENLVDSIKDWIDPDNEVTGFGAEDGYYQTLKRPYSCKNAPLESIEELILIRGVTRELFFGTKANPGISSYLTVHGDGKININTADPLVLRHLSDQIDQEMVEEMVEYRKREKDDLKDPEWYKKVPGMSHVIINPDLLTTLSTYFEIRSEGFEGTMTRSVRAIVERKLDTIRLVSWNTE
ncbi:MAG: type II secretion system minor pseudopilin GspK [Thermodesulfobacteriota bacterium]|nr:type II secretion system minor pseudopilin GspK [Thermodesulfobacteriota bacterium]